MIEAVILGCVVGFLAGLVPGIHSNLVAVFVSSLALDVWFSCVVIISVAISRSVADALPTVFLGASDDFLALSPSHHLLKRGFGNSAVKFLLAGSVLGVIFCLILFPVLLFVFPKLYSLARPFLFWLLLLLILFLLFRDSWQAFLVFFLSGFLGVFSLESVREPLFPLLSGLFGASGLVFGLFSRTSIPSQFESDSLAVGVKRLFGPAAFGVLSGCVVSLFPGLGPSQAASLVKFERFKRVDFLVLLGALGCVDVVVSLVVLFSLGNARNGSVAVVEQFLGVLSSDVLLYFVGVICFSAGCSVLAALYVSNWYSKLFDFVEYRYVSIFVLSFLVLMSYFLSGWLGVLIFVIASVIGLIAPLIRVSRAHAMGCLLLPTLLMLW